MNITLTYVGCETTVVLSEDEIYIPRGGEYITRCVHGTELCYSYMHCLASKINIR